MTGRLVFSDQPLCIYFNCVTMSTFKWATNQDKKKNPHQSNPSIADIPFLSDQGLSTLRDKELYCSYLDSTCPHSGMSDTITGLG